MYQKMPLNLLMFSQYLSIAYYNEKQNIKLLTVAIFRLNENPVHLHPRGIIPDDVFVLAEDGVGIHLIDCIRSREI